MGKKAKFGKNRKDKFYHLAKETGYRARSAFKLIQLNRKFGFLPKSRVLIDLCAAPGGWLQVAQKFMPISSVIIGVDLVPIKPIRNVTTFVADITTDTCKQMIRKEIKTWKADCVLHDGAPNVGSAWVQDAFTQAQLTLSSLKLATEFLNKGGCFVTKIFRSKDYAALLVTFESLFKSVQATKPQASRNESAEIFVVCRGYKAPSKLDQNLLDPKCVFKEPEEDNRIRLNILHPEKQTRQRDGYPENNMGLFTSTKVSEFIETGNPIEILSTSNKLEFDDDEDKYRNHELTTDEVVVCCGDIKVLGKRELRLLFNWRKKLRLACELVKQPKPKEADKAESEDEDSEEKVASMIEEAKKEETATAKRQRRKDQERKQKLGQKMREGETATADGIENVENDLFRLDIIKSSKGLKSLDSSKMDDDNKEFYEDSEEELEFESDNDSDSDASSNYDYHDNDEQYGSKKPGGKRKLDNAEAAEIIKMKKKSKDAAPSENPLIMSYDDGQETVATKAESWFNKKVFQEADESDEDEDYDIEQMMRHAKREGVQIQSENKTKDDASNVDEEGHDDDDGDDDSDEDEVYDIDDRSVAQGKTEENKEKVKKSASSFEVAPLEKQVKYLSAEGLAIGTAMATSKKRRRDIIDDSFNRYSIGAESVPKWFEEEEAQHRVRQMPVTRQEITAYKDRMREINAKPIKKVIEAKAKKKYKLMKKLERARKKAASISEVADVSEKEKMDQIKGVYKKAGLLSKKKTEKTYVVAKKSLAGKKYQRPANVKGIYKVVDPRMKKETRATKRKDKAGKKKRKK